MDTVATLPNRPPVWRRAAVPLLTLMLLASLGVIGYQWWGMREAAPAASPAATQQGDWNGVINAIKAPPCPGGTEMWKTNEQLARLVRDEAAMRAFPPSRRRRFPATTRTFSSARSRASSRTWRCRTRRFAIRVADRLVAARPGGHSLDRIGFDRGPLRAVGHGAGPAANRVIVLAAHTSRPVCRRGSRSTRNR